MSHIVYGIDPAPYGTDAASPSFWQWLTQISQYVSSETFVKTVTAAYSARVTDRVILINGDVTVTLPSAESCSGKTITCKAINAGTGTRTIASAGGSIDGAATWTTTIQYESADFVSNGTQWYLV